MSDQRSAPPLPPSARGRKTRAAFEDAARRAIARHGFLRTTVADIATEAGRSPASFYNYFESKEDLLWVLADQFPHEVIMRARSVIRRDAPPRERIEASARAYWMAYKEHLPVLVGVFQLAMKDDAFAQRWRDIRHVGVDNIEREIRRAQADGFCPDLEPRLAASALASMFEQFCFVWLGQGGEGDTRTSVDDDDAVATLSTIWYHALYWRADATPGAAGSVDGGDGADSP
ncbi:MAG: TetR/AcrR family transcriptional regulator [Acidimicrobiia bacterium]|nr:TetR/AcrR family transcriptional regulator [Acidimicrobiia bacterium]